MKRLFFMLVLCCMVLCVSACQANVQADIASAGRIGDEQPVSRAMAAKTIALAFYSMEELQALEQSADFPDVSKTDWAYPYINGAVALGYLSGDEDGNFYPEQDLTLLQTQYLMDRLAPEYENKIVLDEENQNMPVSYSLWVQLLETVLLEGRQAQWEDYGIQEQNCVLLQAENGLFDCGTYGADGLDLASYANTEMRFLEKDGEIVALQEVVTTTPTIENIYCSDAGGMLRMESGAGSVTLPCDVSPQTGICDVVLTDGVVTELKPAATLGHCTVKRVNGQEIYLAEQGLLDWAAQYRIYDARENMQAKTVSKLICGMNQAEYYLQDGKVVGAVIIEDTLPENIRVMLGGGEQAKVSITAENGFSLKNSEAEKEFAAGETAELSPDLPWLAYGILTAQADTPIMITFADGTTRSYTGTIELEQRQNGIVVLNELPLETYLKGVVPHEMPVDFGETALQAQAITARSYAFRQMLANSYCGYGAHVTDTVASQVYYGADTDPLADAAVDATKGQCLTEDGEVVTTYFYSTSCGYGASANEVWSKDGTFSEESTPYLVGGSHGITGARPTEEKEWLEFFQNWEIAGYDDTSPWYRWKVYFGAGQLTEITQKTLQEAAKRNAAQVCIQQPDGSWQSGTPQDMGKLKGVSVVQRGESGVIEILQLDYAQGSVQIKTEYTIRQVLSPTRLQIGEPIYLQRKDGSSLTGQSMLPSGYFAVKEMCNDAGELTGVALYGGGYGHGVGMSQYGASGMAQLGKNAEEILTHYFKGTKVLPLSQIQNTKKEE